MQFPAFYDPQRVGSSYRPDTEAAIHAGKKAGLEKAIADSRRIALLLVDCQVDFIHEDGSLSVPGAVEDTRRTIEWIFQNQDQISAIFASLDSHLPNQIFYPPWWVDAEGNSPDPYTAISSRDVEEGIWRPQFEVSWSREYVRRLEEEAKKQLMIWPFHTMIGTPGHNLSPALYEAVSYHASARDAQPLYIIKGTLAKTEYYSLLEPEVKVPDDPRGVLNEALLDELMGFDALYVAGQAKSHCVLETIGSIMRYYGDQRQMVEKVHLLTDCCSSVAHPEIDFEAMANEAYALFEKQGLRLRSSTSALE